MNSDYRGRRATVMGLGCFGGGAAAARWLATQGAEVTVTDIAEKEILADSLDELKDVHIAGLHLGGHREEDFHNAELVVVNPAVRPGNPLLEITRQAGAKIDTEIGLFLRACPARVIGVTGSNGKSTTAAMIAAILKAQGFRAWLGGNIGGSLLGKLSEIGPDDWAVLELSSFQLWHTAADVPMPQIAVVTECRPNHLDWHGNYAEYVAAKQRFVGGTWAEVEGDSPIFAAQKLGQSPGIVVLNTHDAEVGSWGGLVQGRQLVLPPLDELPRLQLPGRHNRINAACAAAAAKAAGCDQRAIQSGLANFRGLPQRLEWFAVIDGRRFYNDSTATTPEATTAALESLDGPIWLLAGGADKGCDFGPLVKAIARRTCGVALFGSVAEMLHDRITAENPSLPCAALRTMDESLGWCWERSRPGDLVLLSPACSSHDQFRNFRERGERFVALVGG